MSIVRYKASAPESKYMGAYLKAFTDNLKAYVVEPILEKYHIAEIDPVGWMEAQCSFEELVAVGMKAGEISPPYHLTLIPSANSWTCPPRCTPLACRMRLPKRAFASKNLPTIIIV